MDVDYNKYPLPKRMRHHTSPNLYFKYSELKKTPNYYPPLIDELNWEEIFFNGKRPDMLDIGCGKGRFLLSMSEQFPEKNILGIELRKPAVEWINNVVKGEEIMNCAAIWYSVVNGLNFIEGKSIEKIFYFFPDPWPKKKHLKRRVFSEEFIQECHRILKDKGELFLATDLEEVNEFHKRIIIQSGKFDYKIVTDDNQWQFPETNKENFCRREDVPFYRLICPKK
jgi:tRNA (guanine-N7-)-methyltransferase